MDARPTSSADVDVHVNDAQVDECRRELFVQSENVLKVFDGFFVPAKVEFWVQIKWLDRKSTRLNSSHLDVQ